MSRGFIDCGRTSCSIVASSGATLEYPEGPGRGGGVGAMRIVAVAIVLSGALIAAAILYSAAQAPRFAMAEV